MVRLAQFAAFISTVGAVTIFMGLFPEAIDLDNTPGIGLGQILVTLVGLTLLTLGAYIFVYAMWQHQDERTLIQDIGIRLGLTGLTVAIAASLADVFGFGTHSLSAGVTFGELQASGMVAGFVLAAIGVLVYGIRRDAHY